ncbi:MAG: D-glycerate dehydrogenase [Balneolaceae bacterium]
MRVLVTEPIISSSIELLEQHFDVEVGERGTYDREKAMVKAAAEYDAILTMLSNPVTERVLKTGKENHLKIVADYAVGYNNIDIDAAKRLGIRISNTPDVLTDSTAEIALALLLAAARKTTEAEGFLRERQFEGWDPNQFLGLELHGATLGVVGMGRIGTALARRAKACGMEILYYNRSRVDKNLEKELEATYVPELDRMLMEVDALSIHCPLTDETHHLIDEDKILLMEDHAILVNTARGPIVDEAALAKALHRGQLGGAGLDVYEDEPKVHPDLLTAPNAVLFPHIGSATLKSRKGMGDLAAHAIIGVLNGEESSVPNLVV